MSSVQYFVDVQNLKLFFFYNMVEYVNAGSSHQQ